MGKRAGIERLWRAGLPVVALALLVFSILAHPSAARSTEVAAPAPAPLPAGSTTGVGSCAGSTCHGREEPTGAVVRLDEIRLWQDESSPAGAHSRAWRVLGEARARAIAARLGIGDPQSAPACLGCHASGSTTLSDGVGCEECHGAAGGWLASHYTVGASHAQNIARGMRALEQPTVRAAACLDCHYGSDQPGKFVDHRIMAAGHPRLSFELDLFSTLEKHWNTDADYARRKRAPSAAALWAVGQATALDRALELFANDRLANRGIFPELYFFDCQSCHRRISDEPGYRPSALANPGRDVPAGTVPFQDENMIMLAAAARVGAPDLASRFVADSLAFHRALTAGRPAALAAAARLRADARALAGRLSGMGEREVFAMIAALSDAVTTPRYTDYEGSVQAVMSVDTLLSSLADAGAVSRADVARIRPSIDRAYAATHDPNAYDPRGFRTALRTATNAIGALR